jgi:hypothetical protein
MIHSAWRHVLFAAVFLSLAVGQVGAAETEPPVTALLPGKADVAINSVGLKNIKAALGETDLAKLAAEPEVAQFIKPSWDAVMEFYKEQRGANPLLPDLADLDKIFADDLAVTVGLPSAESPMPAVCAALRVSDPAAAGRLLAPLLKGKPLAEGRFPVTPMPMGPEFSYQKGMLLFASSGPLLDAMLARLADPAKRADSLSEFKDWVLLQKMNGGPGLVSLSVAVQPVISMLMTQLGGGGEQAKVAAVLKKLGVDAFRAAGLQFRARGGQWAVDAAVAVNPDAKSPLLAVLAPKPIPASALKMIPENSGFCSVSRSDLSEMFTAVRGLLDPADVVQMDKGLADIREHLQFDIEKDLLGSLGDVWVMYGVGGTDCFVVPGMALSVSLKDSAKADVVLKKAVDALTKEFAGVGGGMHFGPQFEVRSAKIGAVPVQYLSISLFPISPCVAIVDKQLVVTLTVSSMRRALLQFAATGDITKTAGFKAALERVTGLPLDMAALPGQFSYSCPASSGELFGPAASYGQVMMGVMSMGRRFGGGGHDGAEKLVMNLAEKLDFALVPSDATLLKHIRPTASVSQKVDGGVVVRSEVTVPTPGVVLSGQGSLSNVVLLAAVALPSTLRSRTAANEAAAAASCKAYAEAQEIYRRTDYDGDGILEYAQSIRGNIRPAAADLAAQEIPEPTDEVKAAVKVQVGKFASDDFAEREAASVALEKVGVKAIKLLDAIIKETDDAEVRERCTVVAARLRRSLNKKPLLDTRNGLVSSDGHDGNIGLLDKPFGKAEGNPSDKPTPKNGYCFKILTGQGEAATGGNRSYLAGESPDPYKRNMTLGYALLAYPAKYDSTGRNCFIINNNGTIYQKDLGPTTEKLAEEMIEFNPDTTWAASE